MLPWRFLPQSRNQRGCQSPASVRVQHAIEPFLLRPPSWTRCRADRLLRTMPRGPQGVPNAAARTAPKAALVGKYSLPCPTPERMMQRLQCDLGEDPAARLRYYTALRGRGYLPSSCGQMLPTMWIDAG